MANNLQESLKIKETSGNFRDYLIPLDHPRLHPSDRDARTHAKGVLSNESIFLVPVARGWLQNYEKPFHGFSVDGNIVPDLWHYNASANGPTAKMVEAANGVISASTQEESRTFRFPVDAREWRAWSNPEVIVVDRGLRVEEMSTPLREAVHSLLKASLSEEGYQKVWTAMLMNAFLGDLTRLKNVMNEHSYHFCLFGDPSVDKPWGFNIFGHHLCLNVFTLAGEVVMGPFFVGAEPNVIDDGPNKGLEVLNKEERAGLAFVKSLSPEQQKKATIQGDINDITGETMPEGRWNPADLRGLGGAHQDNRIVPFEGLNAKEMDGSQRKALLDIISIFNELLPAGPKELFMKRVEKYLDDTYFAWIGPIDDKTPFYFRVHSPIVMDEFDHHNGVWLANALPKKYHIHTIQRLPNRGDYGTALYDEWVKKHAGRTTS
ncbi:hypothetical protein BAUCODRAFT_315852 [Baudoinia panamericana UAMH 10762]|uniref:DUF3500 domain-containing protein n=1 Tax=Baudoinia panamericana (strain UAMH 10762) TaxID=717646 RepID=M2MWY1_BAUPA|nr:uncharacterized protein BAUCODRAFT_315852 [Baudoinia panamericana UAMH 10762]EMC91134.1 hypothetical protein BAUCODRAFT_315852 [Baudoinia panamericana UAMH 10762]